MRNPTLETATAYWVKHNYPPPVRFDVPLAMTHKARLQWLWSTDQMLAESIQWLEANGYETTLKGAPPLTPERRDEERKMFGWPSLKSNSGE